LGVKKASKNLGAGARDNTYKSQKVPNRSEKKFAGGTETTHYHTGKVNEKKNQQMFKETPKRNVTKMGGHQEKRVRPS